MSVGVRGTASHQKNDRSGLHGLVILVDDLEAEFQHAALRRRLARPCLERRDLGADGVAEASPGAWNSQETPSRPSAVPSIQFICDIRPIAVDNTSGPCATRVPKMLSLRKFLVDMQRIVVADQAGKQRNVAFADGAAARAPGRVDFEILQIKPQRALPWCVMIAD